MFIQRCGLFCGSEAITVISVMEISVSQGEKTCMCKYCSETLKISVTSILEMCVQQGEKSYLLHTGENCSTSHSFLVAFPSECCVYIKEKNPMVVHPVTVRQ